MASRTFIPMIRHTVRVCQRNAIASPRRFINTKTAPNLYTARAHVVGARTGHVDGENLKVDLTMAKALGGPGDEGKTNPEELFAAGYGACFQSAMNAVAPSLGVKMPTKTEDSIVESTVELVGSMKDLDMGLRVQLLVRVRGLEEADLEKVVKRAREVCPYSRATQGNVKRRATGNGIFSPPAAFDPANFDFPPNFGFAGWPGRGRGRGGFGRGGLVGGGNFGAGGRGRGLIGRGGFGRGGFAMQGGALGRGQFLQNNGGPGNGGFFTGGGAAQRGGLVDGGRRAGRGGFAGRGRRQQKQNANNDTDGFKSADQAGLAGGGKELRWSERSVSRAKSTERDKSAGVETQNGGQPTAIAPMTNLRHLQSDELGAYMQHGGKTAYGERIRGVEGPSVYVGTEITRRQGGGATEQKNSSDASRRAAHPWLPVTELYAQEKTRQKR
ncbi:Nn.00g084690.m01.CDS01 [Neocucurbitaria sp. VM-36]